MTIAIATEGFVGGGLPTDGFVTVGGGGVDGPGGTVGTPTSAIAAAPLVLTSHVPVLDMIDLALRRLPHQYRGTNG